MGTTPNLVEGQIPTAEQWNSYFGGKLDDLGYVYATPTGGTLTAVIKQGGFILEPPTELATLAIVAPFGTIDNQRFFVSTTQTIDALTVTPAPGQSLMVGGPFVLGPGGVEWVFVASRQTWYRKI